jgi:hypothetical protein
MVIIPSVIKHSSSLCILRARYGLMSEGASDQPMKTFAAAARLSLPLDRITHCISQAMPRIT